MLPRLELYYTDLAQRIYHDILYLDDLDRDLSGVWKVENTTPALCLGVFFPAQLERDFTRNGLLDKP